MSGITLGAPVSALGGWAGKWAGPIQSLGLETVADLLHHYPRRYLDRSATERIRDLRVDQEATFLARVDKVETKPLRGPGRRFMVVMKVRDGSGSLEVSWFNQRWPSKKFRPGQEVAVSGKVGAFRGKLRMSNPAVEVLRGGDQDQVHTGRIVPLHPVTEGVGTGVIRRLVFDALEGLEEVRDPIPAEIRLRQGLPSLASALRWIHFPPDWTEERLARDRLKFDELFFLGLGVAFRKRRVEATEKGVAHDPSGELAGRFVKGLPFELTEGQRRAMDEIAEDMAAPRPMNRLLQGDVGSGKTVVALHAAMVAIQSGHQAAVMAPTEVLAAQHFRKVEELLVHLGARRIGEQAPAPQADLFAAEAPEHTLTYALLTGSVTGKERERALEGVRSGTVDLVVGTHALVQEGVEFRDLSLAVVDEQHRFGLHQRIALKQKGVSPDVLIMTATPIPRTLALTYYGDLDVSVLDELPAGRRPIRTMVVRTEPERARAYDLVREQVAAGRQAFVVCAAIDEGNRLEVRAAEQEAERLRTEVFPDLDIALLHGKMRPKDKDARMEAFRSGHADLLIATTVIEVGVDVPNATVMLVENAERFGLAQLHQLRGRIGRGEHDSLCVLFDESAADNEDARERVAALARTTDGFELADEDLRLRGEGTLFDIRQSGMPDLRLAKLARDTELVGRARDEAFGLIAGDPELRRHPELRREMERRFADSIDWLFHS